MMLLLLFYKPSSKCAVLHENTALILLLFSSSSVKDNNEPTLVFFILNIEGAIYHSCLKNHSASCNAMVNIIFVDDAQNSFTLCSVCLRGIICGR